MFKIELTTNSTGTCKYFRIKQIRINSLSFPTGVQTLTFSFTVSTIDDKI